MGRSISETYNTLEQPLLCEQIVWAAKFGDASVFLTKARPMVDCTMRCSLITLICSFPSLHFKALRPVLASRII